MEFNVRSVGLTVESVGLEVMSLRLKVMYLELLVKLWGISLVVGLVLRHIGL